MTTRTSCRHEFPAKIIVPASRRCAYAKLRNHMVPTLPTRERTDGGPIAREKVAGCCALILTAEVFQYGYGGGGMCAMVSRWLEMVVAMFDDTMLDTLQGGRGGFEVYGVSLVALTAARQVCLSFVVDVSSMIGDIGRVTETVICLPGRDPADRAGVMGDGRCRVWSTLSSRGGLTARAAC